MEAQLTLGIDTEIISFITKSGKTIFLSLVQTYQKTDYVGKFFMFIGLMITWFTVLPKKWTKTSVKRFAFLWKGLPVGLIVEAIHKIKKKYPKLPTKDNKLDEVNALKQERHNLEEEIERKKADLEKLKLEAAKRKNDLFSDYCNNSD